MFIATLRKLLPAFFAGLIRRYRWRQGRWPQSEWSGDYPDWASAEAASEGYDNTVILDRVTAATREVLAGRAAFERDSVTFTEFAYDPRVLSSLKDVMNSSHGILRVTDFGGSLGSLYYQYRPWLVEARRIQWVVIEQPHFVQRGQEITPPGDLSFVSSLRDTSEEMKCGVLLLGSVLSYIQEPWKLIQEAISLNFQYILIDRTACMRNRSTRLTVQHVPESVYPASYPAWLFNEAELKQPFRMHYRLCRESVSPFSSLRIQEDGAEVQWKSFFFERKP